MPFIKPPRTVISPFAVRLLLVIVALAFKSTSETRLLPPAQDGRFKLISAPAVIPTVPVNAEVFPP